MKRLTRLFVFVIFFSHLLNVSAVATQRNMPKDLDEVALESDTIVIGYVLDDARQIEAHNVSMSHRTTLCIVDVIKGNVSNNEEISIIEPYGYTTYDGETHLNRLDSYGPSKPGRAYLFFLNSVDVRAKNLSYDPPDIWKGAYFLTWGDLSRYPVFVEEYSEINRELQPEDFDLIPNNSGMSVSVKFDTYLEFYKEAIQTYISKGDWQAQYPLQEKSGYSITVLVVALIAVSLVGAIIFIRVKR